MKRLISIMVLTGLIRCAAADDFELPLMPPENRTLAERFIDPPPSARILKIIHSQRDEPARQNAVLQKLSEQGFGGFAGNVRFKGYIEDPTAWPPFIRAVNLARDAGMTLWLYDECGYPSGSADDLTLRGHPEWAARGLLIAETNTVGGAISLHLPPGALVSAVAVPRRAGAIVLAEAVDLSAQIRRDKLEWQAPAGDWYVAVMTDDLIYEGTHAAISLAFKKPCINLLMPEPTARFLEVTHEQYAKRFGTNLGKFFAATFTDEPSLQNYWFTQMPYRVLPWSENLPDAFEKRSGMALKPLLPALLVGAGAEGSMARYMFWDTVAALVSENYFGQIQRWCRRHDIVSGGHLLLEEHITAHAAFYGDLFRSLRRMDAPGIDCLTSLPDRVRWDVARMARSVADLQGSELVMCEVSDHVQRHRKEGDKRPVIIVSEADIRGTCHRLLWGGINTLTSYYAFRDLDDDQMRRLNCEIGRCSTMLAGGHIACDVAMLYPIESLWPRFAPTYKGATAEVEAYRVERVFNIVGNSLYQNGSEFSYVDSQAILDSKVKKGLLTHDKLRWRVLVLPMCDTLPLKAWHRIHEFWRMGGVVVAVGARPANSVRDWPSSEALEIGNEIFGNSDAMEFCYSKNGGSGIFVPENKIAFLPQVLDSVLKPAVEINDKRAPVKVSRRSIDDYDVYFVINDSSVEWKGVLTFNGNGVSEQWNPVTGRMTPLRDGKCVALELGPYRAMLLRGKDTASAEIMKGGGFSEAALETSALPVVKPSFGHGTYVSAELRDITDESWSSEARLTRGNVDTHLFVRFKYEQPLNLNDCAGFAFDSTVPEAQQVAAELLLILETNDGFRYLAKSGRTLNEAGQQRSYVLFDQFEPFNNKKRAPEVMNRGAVKSVSFGWGGYYGSEGQRVHFKINSPLSFKLGSW